MSGREEGFVRSAVPSRAARRPSPRGAVTRGGVCCGLRVYRGECARLCHYARAIGVLIHGELCTHAPLWGTARRRRLCSRPGVTHPGERGWTVQSGWSPSPAPRAAPGSDRLSPVWGGKSTATTSLPSLDLLGPLVRGPGPQPGYPGAGAGVQDTRPRSTTRRYRGFSSPLRSLGPGAGGNRGPHTEPPRPAGAGGCRDPKAE